MVGYPSDSLASCMKVRERDGGAEVTLAGRSFHMGGGVNSTPATERQIHDIHSLRHVDQSK